MTKRGVVVGAIYVAFMVALAGVASWPIYATWWFVIVAAASAVVGAAIAILSKRIKASGWITALMMVVAMYATAVGLGVPTHWSAGTVVPDGLREAALGFVTGFKDLITAPLPVGDYRNLLVPAIAVFTIGTFVAVRFAFVSGRRAGLSVLAVGAMLFFGLLFGRTSVSAPLELGALTITAPIEKGIGVIALVASVWWLSWRASDERRLAIEHAARATGMKSASSRTGAYIARIALAAGMVVVAVAASAVVVPSLLQSKTRDVIRSTVGPEILLTTAETPLSNYRTNFSDDAADAVLFSYTSAGEVPERIRLATLARYDGESYRVAIDAASPYERVPSRLEADPGEELTLRVEINALRGIWLPTFGSLEEIQFQGPSGPELADGFYYNADSGTGVVVGGVAAGESYLVTATQPDPGALEDADSPGANPVVRAPESLVTWLEQQGVSSDGAGLAQALQTLRDRGYLSHSLLPNADGAPAKWMTMLPGYGGFQSSAAGHSLARIDDLFTQLLEHESQVQGLENPSLVAAVGDDEQFAVAGALIAGELGFPARVVVGVRTSSESLPACDGQCLASDLSVWLEVQDTSNQWIPVDMTPQYENSMDVDSRTQRDPENYTDVRPNEAKEVAPPDPQQQESEQESSPNKKSDDSAAVLNVLRIAGIGVLAAILLLAPFITVLVAKLIRRKERKKARDSVDRITGGWDEYVDAAVDAGKPAPTVQTRHELATQYATPAGTTLAAQADHAEFSNAVISDEEAAEFWSIVSAERAAIKKENGWFKRVRAALSLKSFVRELAMKAPVKRRNSKKRAASKRTARAYDDTTGTR